MYARDAADIRSFVSVGVAGWEARAAGVIVAAAFTMQHPTPRVLGDLRDFAAGTIRLGDRGQDKNLWGNRGLLVRAACDGTMFAALSDAAAIMSTGKRDVDTLASAMMCMKRVKGLAYVKIGFVMQMLWQCVGCIDSQNAAKYGALVYSPKAGDGGSTYAGQYAVAHKYITMIQSAMATVYPGQDASEVLWDEWCQHEWQKWPAASAIWPNGADDVSREHCQWVRLAYQGVAACIAGTRPSR